MEDKLEDYAKKSLGDSTSYAIYTDKYDSSLLNPMPRELGRKDWDIDSSKFKGYDVWNCHEASFLTNNGLPVAGTLKFCYSSNSEMMVESKSMKLFLNSFDMCKMGSSIEDSINNYCKIIKEELEKIVSVEVIVSFFLNNSPTFNIFQNSIVRDLNETSMIEFEEFSDYKGKEFHLKFDSEVNLGTLYPLTVNTYTTNILRSRCRHTLQKDTGTAFITIITEGGVVDSLSLLKQIISLRECNEFHELLSEKLFQDIMSLDGVLDCTVLLMYNRRGSLDINPIRTSSLISNEIVRYLIDPSKLIEKTQGQ